MTRDVEALLAETLERHAEEVRPHPDPLPDLERRLRARSWRRTVITAAAAAGAVAATATGVLLATSPTPSSPTPSPGTGGGLVPAESDRSADGVRVTISTHCGVRSAWVDGELWLASPPLGGHNPPPGWDENETVGFFVITAPERAEFHGDGRQKALFRLAEPGTPDPNAGCE